MVEFENSNLSKIINERSFNIKNIPSLELLDSYLGYTRMYFYNKYMKTRNDEDINGRIENIINKEINNYLRKVKFFEGSGFAIRLSEGLIENAGYISYIGYNGLVFMEKYFDVYNKILIPSKSNIIKTDLCTFMETGGVYELSKEEMMNSDKFTFIRHSTNFENSINSQIYKNDQELTNEMNVYYDQEIKKILRLRFPNIK